MQPVVIHSSQTPVARVASHIRRLIARNHKPGDILPRQGELASELRVSMRTVSAAVRLLSRQGIVRPVPHHGTIVRRRLAPDEPALSQVALVSRYNIGRMFEAYIGQIAMGFCRRLDEIESKLTVFPSHRTGMTPMAEVQSSGVEAAALLGVFDPAYLRPWTGQDLPVVVMDHCDETIPLDYVVCDNLGAMRAVLGHLHALGHRRVEYVALSAAEGRDSDSRERHEAFAAGCRELGMRHTQPYWPPRDFAAGGPDGAIDAHVRLLTQRQDRITSLVTEDGGTAAIVIDALAARGVRVPEQVSVAAVAQHQPLRNASELTSVTCTLMDFPAMGRRSVDILIERMHSPAPEKANIVRVGFTLTVGRTTAAPPRPAPPRFDHPES
jgi:DNA-binding LacI/PurR family transcriptional regulator